MAQVPPTNHSRAFLLQPPRPITSLPVMNFSAGSLENRQNTGIQILGLHREQKVSETPSSSSYLYSLSSLSSSLETASDAIVNSTNYVKTTSHYDAEPLRHPIPFSPLLAPVHLSLLITGKKTRLIC
jgi:hypothetical protein